MKPHSFILFSFLLATILIITPGCRKKIENAFINKDNTQERFFRYEKNNPVILAIRDQISRQDQAKPFTKEMTGYAGYPYWEKTIIYKHLPCDGNTRETSTGKAIVLIPFVKDFTSYVNAVLVVRITGGDTTMNMIYHWQYASFGYTNTSSRQWSAYDVFNLFASLEYSVFGHARFEIHDTSLIHHNPEIGHPVITRQNNTITSFTERSGIVAETECTTWGICIPGGYARTMLNCYESGTMDICTTYYYDTDSNTGGNGSGTGGSGGGWSDNPCRNLPGAGGNSCGSPPAWLPLTDDSNLPIDPVDSLLARYSRAINRKADSLMELSASHNSWEWVMTIVKKDTAIYGKNFKTDLSNLHSAPDLSLSFGESLIGTLHVHHRPVISDRSAPSPSDIFSLSTNLISNFIEFIECGNVRYGLCVENTAKAAYFFKNNNLRKIYKNYLDTVMAQPNYFNDWQGATTTGALNILGPSNNCGIGFYISTNADKTLYHKLN